MAQLTKPAKENLSVRELKAIRNLIKTVHLDGYLSARFKMDFEVGTVRSHTGVALFIPEIEEDKKHFMDETLLHWMNKWHADYEWSHYTKKFEVLLIQFGVI